MGFLWREYCWDGCMCYSFLIYTALGQISYCRVSSQRWRRSLGHLVQNPDLWILFLVAWTLECLVLFLFFPPAQLVIFIATEAKLKAIMGQNPSKTQTVAPKTRRFELRINTVCAWAWAKGEREHESTFRKHLKLLKLLWARIESGSLKKGLRVGVDSPAGGLCDLGSNWSWLEYCFELLKYTHPIPDNVDSSILLSRQVLHTGRLAAKEQVKAEYLKEVLQ